MDNRVFLPTNTLPLISNIDYCLTQDGFVHPDRVMDVNVLLLVEKGSFHIWEEDEEFTVEAGEMIFLKQGLHHFGDLRCPRGTSWFYIHFHLPENTGFSEINSSRDFMYVEGSGTVSQAPCFPLPKKMRLTPGSITAKFHTLNEMVKSTDPEVNLLSNAFLYQILMEIYSEGVLRPVAGSAELKVKELMGLMDEQKNSPFDSSLLEKSMGLSYKHLNVLFKSVTGQTLQKYHAHIRMNEAARLLKETTLGIGEISNRLGFEEAFYFSNCFKKEYGMSPANYRKQGIFI